MARTVSYASVRNYLGREFKLSKTSTGRRSGQRWSEGVQVRTSYSLGVIVDYTENSAEWSSGGRLRRGKLAEVRKHLEQRFTVDDHPAADGRLIVSN
ncbi:hypothetical protein [Streptomyces sp. NBC_01180]|uniref:hypothetical protein n=1 Tax=Streptomyces sp. NBC_01180 TaxID=2903763 RepID=UPI0038634D33|nr:hypothetical protein OG708_09015 [Streptomyces sp. NBC_01180]